MTLRHGSVQLSSVVPAATATRRGARDAVATIAAMSRPRSRAGLPSRLLLALLLLPAVADAQEADWRTYLGDPGRRHYSPLDEITRDNVHRLQSAWRYDSGELRDGVSLMYTSPLIVDGVLYGLSPRLVAFALDAATGGRAVALRRRSGADRSAGPHVVGVGYRQAAAL